MADLSLDLSPASAGTPAYGDLLLRNGDLVLTTDANPLGTAPVLQHVLQRLRFFLGEWFMDTTKGTPWLQQILTKSAAAGPVGAILQNVILGTPGVVGLLAYTGTIDRVSRTIRISFRAQSTSGVIDYSQTLAPLSGGRTT